MTDKTSKSRLSALSPTLSARIEALEAGLRPFADAAENIEDTQRDTSEVWEHPAALCITLGDLRRARSLLPEAPHV